MEANECIARRRFLKHLGIGAITLVAVGAGTGGYFLYRKNNEISEAEGQNAPIVRGQDRDA